MWAWALLTWWYGAGWINESRLQLQHLDRVEDYFSFSDLLRTLFQPFRQIDAASRRGSISVQLRAFFDRTFSRLIGAAARLVLLVIGGIWWILSAIISIGWLALWPLLPAAPLLGIIAAAIGVNVL